MQGASGSPSHFDRSLPVVKRPAAHAWKQVLLPEAVQHLASPLCDAPKGAREAAASLPAAWPTGPTSS